MTVESVICGMTLCRWPLTFIEYSSGYTIGIVHGGAVLTRDSETLCSVCYIVVGAHHDRWR